MNRNATAKEIKAQFYSLSKKYHPDLNREDEGAKKKFQEVSEAWNVLGSERSRREYDRQQRSGFAGAGGGAGGVNTRPGAGYHYDANDNTSRRARATYAWEYQRRRSDSNRSRAGASRTTSSGSSRGSDTPGSSPFSGSIFEEYAARQRRREEFVSSRSGESGRPGSTSGASTAGSKEHEAHQASPILRFVQVGGVFMIVFTVGTALSSNDDGRRRRPM